MNNGDKNIMSKDILNKKFSIDFLDFWSIKTLSNEIRNIIENPKEGSHLSRVDRICLEYTLKDLDKIVEKVENDND